MLFQLSSVLDILPCFVLLSILLCILGCVVLFLVYIRSTDKIIHPILRVTYLTTLLSCRVTTSPHWLHRLMTYAYSFTDHFINHRLKQIANIVAHRRHIVKKEYLCVAKNVFFFFYSCPFKSIYKIISLSQLFLNCTCTGSGFAYGPSLYWCRTNDSLGLIKQQLNC